MRLHFIDETAKVDTAYYCVDHLLPKLAEDCNQQLPVGFIFQQEGTPAHTARIAQEWVHVQLRVHRNEA